jgi:acyl-CoA synthetase (AMP-forming)/AMP-acid ligase II
MRAMDAAAALAGLVGRLTAPGGPFEIVEEDVRGHRMPVYRNRNRSLPELLDAAAGHGEKDYLVTPDRHLSYTQHDAAVAALVTRLRDEYGIAKGDRVAILGANSPEWIVAFWAVTSLGAIVAAFNAWWAPPELAHAVELSAPKLIIAEARYAEDLAADAPVLRTAGLCDASPRAQRPHTDIDEDDPAVIVFTSGTTGRPKGATHSHRNLLAAVDYHRLMNAITAYTRPDVPPASGRWLLSMPLFHIAGLHNLAVPRLATGETVVMTQGAFEPRAVLDLVVARRVTNWAVVPTMARRLLAQPDLGRYDLSALRSFTLATAPSSQELQDELRRHIPAAKENLVDSYGLTESTTAATVAGGPILAAHPGTVGAPIPTVSIDIRDGEIWLRSPLNMLGYWHDEEATNAVFADGWMRTGDLGELRDGLLYVNSRRTDLIIRGGENVYPVEVEQVLEQHPAVRECVVFGVDHPDLGQQVAVVVVPETAVTVEELADFARQRLAYYKVPTDWRLSTEPLPRTVTGKVIRRPSILARIGDAPVR